MEVGEGASAGCGALKGPDSGTAKSNHADVFVHLRRAWRDLSRSHIERAVRRGTPASGKGSLEAFDTST